MFVLYTITNRFSSKLYQNIHFRILSIDRPFFCAIRDEKTGTILFLGSIVYSKDRHKQPRKKAGEWNSRL
ncbi:MAG: hypothetical protein WBB29_22015 [Geitlerinemataceae cyanobacterium]